MRYVIAFCILFLPAWSSLSAQQLWQAANIGDSPQEIRSKFPEAIISENPNADILHGGEQCLVRIPKYVVSSATFRTCFYFSDGQLSQVTIGLVHFQPTDSIEALFDRVLESLTSKYGPADSQEDKSGMMTMRDRDWYLGKVNISVVLVHFGDDDDDPVLNINYQTRMGKDADKL